MNPPASRQVARDVSLLALGAVLYTIACPPFGQSWAAWIALTPLCIVLRHRRPRAALILGFLQGILCCAGIGYWVYVAVVQYFSLPFPLDVLFTVLNYGFFAGVYFALAGVFISLVLRHGHPLTCAVGIPAIWVASELARSSLFAGIAWELLGYTQYRHLPLIQITDLTGVYGLSFLLVLSSYVVAELLVSGFKFQVSRPADFPWFASSVLLIGLTFTLLYGDSRLRRYSMPPASASAVAVTIVQQNVPGARDWNRINLAHTLRQYIAATRRSVAETQPDLIVWPEFALGFYLNQDRAVQTQLAQLSAAIKAPLLVGAPRAAAVAGTTHYYNSAYLFSPNAGLVDVYDKIRLIPFAEYVPAAFSSLRTLRTGGPNNFTAGSRATIFSLPAGDYGVLICHEVTYPLLAQRLTQNGARFLINISNDTWGATEGAAAQHFSMAVFRAVENRRYLIRSANAGISGVVDPTGRPRHLLREGEEATTGILFPLQEMTIYVRYGDWFAWACTGAAIVTVFSARRRTVAQT